MLIHLSDVDFSHLQSRAINNFLLMGGSRLNVVTKVSKPKYDWGLSRHQEKESIRTQDSTIDQRKGRLVLAALEGAIQVFIGHP